MDLNLSLMKMNVMIRPSGTEPLLRIYAEGSSEERAESILSKTIKTISN